MRLTLLLFLLLPISSVAQDSNFDLENYVWKPWQDTLAIISVPKGFDEDHWNYGEGVLTTLSYPDSSYILLHFGGMIQLPLMKSSDHMVIDKKETEFHLHRSGESDNNLYWKEVNLKGKMINLAYDNVIREKQSVFNESLDSFIWKRQ